MQTLQIEKTMGRKETGETERMRKKIKGSYRVKRKKTRRGAEREATQES